MVSVSCSACCTRHYVPFVLLRNENHSWQQYHGIQMSLAIVITGNDQDFSLDSIKPCIRSFLVNRRDRVKQVNFGENENKERIWLCFPNLYNRISNEKVFTFLAHLSIAQVSVCHGAASVVRSSIRQLFKFLTSSQERLIRNPIWPPWPLIDWYIFNFFSRTVTF